MNVIAVFDIGKTNKKIFLFDKHLNVVHTNSVRFEEILDDDGCPCDDIESIENWIKAEICSIQESNEYRIKAINFSTHGATLVYLDRNGNRITPLYNYLKPLDMDFATLYEAFGGVTAFSRKTASPAYGMLNSGLQIYWLKYKKPHFWSQVSSILHYPQYLSYLFSNQIKADYTSIGAHTALWDFDSMRYHPWLASEKITLPEPEPGDKAFMIELNGSEVAIGKGLHDSTSSIVPLLEDNLDSHREFVFLSTGTWIISMNPFSKEVLTQHQLKNNCLCFMTPEKRQIKSSMQFLGWVHEINAEALEKEFGVPYGHHKMLTLKKELCSNTISNSESMFFRKGIPKDYLGDFDQVDNLENYEHAYYQLVFELAQRVFKAVQLILDSSNNLKDVYVSGGFKRNQIFIEYLCQMMPNQKIRFPKGQYASALGAAMLMKSYMD